MLILQLYMTSDGNMEYNLKIIFESKDFKFRDRKIELISKRKCPKIFYNLRAYFASLCTNAQAQILSHMRPRFLKLT